MLIHHRTAAADKTGLVNHCLVYCSKALSTADLTGPSWGVKVQGLNKEQLSPGAFFFFFFHPVIQNTALNAYCPSAYFNFAASFPPISQGQRGV